MNMSLEGKKRKNLHQLFNPKSIAIVGASNNPGKWGANITRNILIGGFPGEVYPINPKETEIMGLKCYPKLEDLSETPDLIFCCIPSQFVPGLMEQAAALNNHNMVVISSNFSEVGPEGAQLEKKIISIANQHEINFVGPNTMGIISNPAKTYAVWAFDFAPQGPISICSQSGNLGTQLVNWSYREGIGISRYVGSGNEAYLKTEDYLEYFGEDPETKVIALYMEGLDNGRRFLDIASKVAKDKPIVVLKRGTTKSGTAAAKSHTGALSGDAKVYEAAFKQAGITIAENSQDLLDFAKAFSLLPKPKGKKLAIITLGGGWGVVSADAADHAGLELAELSEHCLSAIDKELPEYWSRQNPIDLVGVFNRSAHLKILEAVLAEDNIDSIMILGMILGRKVEFRDILSMIKLRTRVIETRPANFPRYLYDSIRGYMENFGLSKEKILKQLSIRKTLKGDTSKKKSEYTSSKGNFSVGDYKLLRDKYFGKLLMDLQKKYNKPLMTITFYTDLIPDFTSELQMTSYDAPEKGVRALSVLTDYALFLQQREPDNTYDKECQLHPVNTDKIRKEIETRSAFTEAESKKILSDYGIPIPKEIVVSSSDKAIEAANKMGYPVVLKIDSPDIQHKSDIGALAVGIKDEEELRKQYDHIIGNVKKKAPKAKIKGMIVSEMVQGDIEILLGMSTDPQFGPVLAFGLGGIFVEIFKDVSLKVLPITKNECLKMIKEVKSYEILKGARGKAPVNLENLVDIVWSFSRLAWDLKDQIKEMEINPLIIREDRKSAVALDALIIKK